MPFDVTAEATEIGITVAPDLTFEEWLAAGEQALIWFRSVWFVLGDVILYGARHFPDRYAQLVDDRNAATCRKAEYVCERIPPPRRRPTLSFSHHDAVASLEPAEQDELLGLAESGGWTRSMLREEIRRRHPRQQNAEPPARPATPFVVVDAGAGNTAAPLPDDVRPAHNDSHPPGFGQPWPDCGHASGRCSYLGCVGAGKCLAVGLVKARDLVPTRTIDYSDPEQVFGRPRSNGNGNGRDIAVLPLEGPRRITDEQAAYLYSIGRTAASPALRTPLLSMLAERDLALRLAVAAVKAVELGAITPELRASVRDWLEA